MPAIRNTTSSSIHLARKSQSGPLTRSRALKRLHELNAERLFPSIASALNSPQSTASTDGDDERSQEEDGNIFDVNVSPAPLPPTSPAPDTQFSPSPMSTITPRRYHQTRATTPVTPTPMARASKGNAKKLQRTYAMVFSPVAKQPSSPMSAPMDVTVDSDQEPTGQTSDGMWIIIHNSQLLPMMIIFRQPQFIRQSRGGWQVWVWGWRKFDRANTAFGVNRYDFRGHCTRPMVTSGCDMFWAAICRRNQAQGPSWIWPAPHDTIIWYSSEPESERLGNRIQGIFPIWKLRCDERLSNCKEVNAPLTFVLLDGMSLESTGDSQLLSQISWHIHLRSLWKVFEELHWPDMWRVWILHVTFKYSITIENEESGIDIATIKGFIVVI